MTKEEAIERALELHWERRAGEEPTGATERWVEIMEDESRPGPIRDVLCWVVEFSGDDGPTVDVYIEVDTGAIVKRSVWG